MRKSCHATHSLHLAALSAVAIHAAQAVVAQHPPAGVFTALGRALWILFWANQKTIDLAALRFGR